MLSERAVTRSGETKSDSFAIDLGKWHSIMQAYENGGHAYHATMPTDALRDFRDTMLETQATTALPRSKTRNGRLGNGVRALLARQRRVSVAADGFGAPGVVVSYTADADVQTASGLPPKACRSPPVCRCNVTSLRISDLPVSGCSAWTSCTMWRPRCASGPRVDKVL